MTTPTETLRTDLSDNFHQHAVEAGLVHVDGWGSRSVFEGTRDQWVALRDILRVSEQNAVNAAAMFKLGILRPSARNTAKVRELAGNVRSVRAAIKRVEFKIGA